jgi:zinc/manganese transport system ATP-binding protein
MSDANPSEEPNPAAGHAGEVPPPVEAPAEAEANPKATSDLPLESEAASARLAHLDEGASSPEERGPFVAMREARIGYRGLPLVEGVNLTIEGGDFIAIVGPNGSGKTTILRTILGTLKPLAGEVAVNARIGYSPQRSQLDPIFPFTAEEVVAMGLLGIEETAEEIDLAANREQVAKAMDACGMLAMRDRLFRELSGGQKQRVLVARALVSEPEMLILDEPTNDLDLRGEYEVMELVKRLHADGRTVIMVSHILPVVARYAHTIALLTERRLLVDRAEAILTAENLERLYGIPVEVFTAESGRRFVSGGRDS